MKKGIVSLASMFLGVVGFAATVYVVPTEFTSQPLTGQENLTSDNPYTFQSTKATNNIAYFSNVVQGTYQLQLVRPVGTLLYTLVVPATGPLLDAFTLWTSQPTNPVATTPSGGATTNWVLDTFYPRSNPSNFISGWQTLWPFTSITNSPWVTPSVTNGLASKQYAQGLTNGFVGNGVTNGLARTQWVGSYYYPLANPLHFVDRSVTNGLTQSNIYAADLLGFAAGSNTVFTVTNRTLFVNGTSSGGGSGGDVPVLLAGTNIVIDLNGVTNRISVQDEWLHGYSFPRINKTITLEPCYMSNALVLIFTNGSAAICFGELATTNNNTRSTVMGFVDLGSTNLDMTIEPVGGNIITVGSVEADSGFRSSSGSIDVAGEARFGGGAVVFSPDGDTPAVFQGVVTARAVNSTFIGLMQSMNVYRITGAGERVVNDLDLFVDDAGSYGGTEAYSDLAKTVFLVKTPAMGAGSLQWEIQHGSDVLYRSLGTDSDVMLDSWAAVSGTSPLPVVSSVGSTVALRNDLRVVGNITTSLLTLQTTNDAPTGVTLGGTPPDVWFVVTNDITRYMVPGWINH